ncbi:hypothetical protein SARC_13983, partial [Sphaeroforma arctica JP610]
KWKQECSVMREIGITFKCYNIEQIDSEPCVSTDAADQLDIFIIRPLVQCILIEQPITWLCWYRVVHILGCSANVDVTCLAAFGNARAFRLGLSNTHVNGMSQIVLEDFEVHSCRDHAMHLRADSVALHGMTLYSLKPDLDHGFFSKPRVARSIIYYIYS